MLKKQTYTKSIAAQTHKQAFITSNFLLALNALITLTSLQVNTDSAAAYHWPALLLFASLTSQTHD